VGYQVNGKMVPELKLVLVSISEDAVVGEADYVSALKKAETYVLDANEKFILIKGLSLSELKGLKE
ncbi:MAG: hypothetical protein ACI4TG_07005, partial [Ruminococcus sp.]